MFKKRGFFITDYPLGPVRGEFVEPHTLQTSPSTSSSEGMSFDEYFDIDYEAPLGLQALKLALGSAPAGFHLKYIQPAAFDLGNRKAPSIASGCKLASGMVITKAILALLHPDELKPLPHYTCYDARLNRLKKGYLWMGNRNPIQQLKFFIARKRLRI